MGFKLSAIISYGLTLSKWSKEHILIYNLSPFLKKFFWLLRQIKTSNLLKKWLSLRDKICKYKHFEITEIVDICLWERIVGRIEKAWTLVWEHYSNLSSVITGNWSPWVSMFSSVKWDNNIDFANVIGLKELGSKGQAHTIQWIMIPFLSIPIPGKFDKKLLGSAYFHWRERFLLVSDLNSWEYNNLSVGLGTF